MGHTSHKQTKVVTTRLGITRETTIEKQDNSTTIDEMNKTLTREQAEVEEAMIVTD